MTKKDFIMLAAIILEYRQGFERQDTAGAEMASAFADAFEKAFPRFKRDVWMKACGGVGYLDSKKAAGK